MIIILKILYIIVSMWVGYSIIDNNNKMSNFFVEAFKRWQAPTPSFFKKFVAIGVALSTCGVGLVGIPGIPAKLSAIGSTMIWVGSAIATVAKFAVTSSTSDLDAK